MRYIEAPTSFDPSPDDPPAVFLAGGISRCPDWQAEVRHQLVNEDCVVLNPRRAEFDLTDPDGERDQVRWECEHRKLEHQTVMMFWFPKSESDQPIALLELGAELAKPGAGRRLVVGADPAYLRYGNLVEQCRNDRPEIQVHYTLLDTIAAARSALHELQGERIGIKLHRDAASYLNQLADTSGDSWWRKIGKDALHAAERWYGPTAKTKGKPE